MMGKIGITLEDLKALAITASHTGTEREFISLAMQWAEEAVKEVGRLRSELKSTESACLRAGILQCDTCGKWRNKLLLSLCCKDKDNE